MTRVRPAAVAGSFYPAAPDVLAATVDELLERADAHRASVRALVVPHAGFVYSGPVAATAYRAVDPAAFERVVLLGPSHRAPLRGLAVPSVDAFATPLGLVPVDTRRRDELVARGLAVVDDRAHAPEHSLEVQLPFLQRVLPGVAVLPTAVGVATPDAVAAVIDALWEPTTLVVASTDLSHYEDYASARAHDTRTAGAVVAGAAIDGADDELGPSDACGVFALRGLVRAARHRGHEMRLLDLRSSGDTAGTRDRVVGYGAFMVEAA